MLLIKKCQFLSIFSIEKKRLEIMLGDFGEKKETFFFTLNHIFLIGVNPCF